MHPLTESIYRRLLREATEQQRRGEKRLAQAEGLAAYSFRNNNNLIAVLYDPKYLIDNIDNILNGGNVYVLHRVMQGIIEISKTRDPCNGAWEIERSAIKNKGEGGLIYGLAFAMSPTGILTPSRGSVSQRAQQGWIQQKGRNGKPFDHAGMPQNQDPSDDCRLHNDYDLCKGGHIDLDSHNRSYEEEGWESALFSKLEEAHESTFDQLDSPAATTITNLFQQYVEGFFVKHLY